MTTARTLLFTLLAMFTLQATATAQLPPMPPAPTSLVGNYDITNLDGTPVSPGNSVSIEVSVQGGVMIGLVRVNGVTLPGETVTFELVAANPLIYSWTNVAGNSGLVAWNVANQRFEQRIFTGPNAGSVRALCPR
tara:strand:- start:15901 stop:16305 length:405 start_codon:yes stop_codon:yes gene_type:complete